MAWTLTYEPVHLSPDWCIRLPCVVYAYQGRLMWKGESAATKVFSCKDLGSVSQTVGGVCRARVVRSLYVALPPSTCCLPLGAKP